MNRRIERLNGRMDVPMITRLKLGPDGRLFVSLVIVSIAVLFISWAAIRHAQHQLLKNEASATATHWARFLEDHLSGLDEILAAGLISEGDQRIFNFASAAGGVLRYQVRRSDGIVAFSSWSGDFGESATNPEVIDKLRRGSTVTRVIELDSPNGPTSVVGEAYIPIMDGDGFRGAVRVDVDMTARAAQLARFGDLALAAITGLLVFFGGLCGALIWRNIRARGRKERMEQSRSKVLERLAADDPLEGILLMLAQDLEGVASSARCSVLLLDRAANRLRLAAAPSLPNFLVAAIDGLQVGTGIGSCGTAAHRGERVVIDDLMTHPYSAGFRKILGRAGLRSCWSEPILSSDGGTLGVLGLYWSKPRTPSRLDLELVQSAAQLAGLAIERKEADDALGRLQRQNTLFLNSAGEGIYGLDRDGRTTFVNPAAVRMIGWNVEDLIGQFQHEVLHHSRADGSPYPRNECPIYASISDGAIHQVSDEVFWRKDGSCFAVEYTSTPIRESGEITGAVVVFRDITERQRAQAELRLAKDEAELANRSKSTFLANMSHELRTPLNAIIGFSELIANDSVPLRNLDYRGYAKDINESGRHLLDLINDILDLSKMEAGKLELHEEDFEVPPVIRSCLTLVKERAHRSGVKLACDIRKPLPLVRADQCKLKQVLVNLLSNAVKFTPSGGVVSVRVRCHGNVGYEFEVHDTGIGIAPEHINQAFAPFGQVDSDLNRKYEGTGLGLPLSKALVEQHGGTLELQSAVNVGTTVTVRFPAWRVVEWTAEKGAARA